MLLLDSTDRPNWLTSDELTRQWNHLLRRPLHLPLRHPLYHLLPLSLSARRHVPTLYPLLFVHCSLSAASAPTALTASRGIHPQINVFRRSDVCDPWPWTKLIPPNDLRTEPIPPTDPLKTKLPTDLWMWCSCSLSQRFAVAKVCNRLSPLFNNISSWFVKNNISSWLVNLCEPLRPSVTADKKKKERQDTRECIKS